jgi:hypothetical protein
MKVLKYDENVNLEPTQENLELVTKYEAQARKRMDKADRADKEARMEHGSGSKKQQLTEERAFNWSCCWMYWSDQKDKIEWALEENSSK